VCQYYNSGEYIVLVGRLRAKIRRLRQKGVGNGNLRLVEEAIDEL
jgi:hypothetical protein